MIKGLKTVPVEFRIDLKELDPSDEWAIKDRNSNIILSAKFIKIVRINDSTISLHLELSTKYVALTVS